MHELQAKDLRLSEDVPSFSTFSSMGLSVELLKAVYKCGYDQPSLIQQKAIRQIIEGRDVIAQAQNGTGKTAAFSIGALHNIDCKNRKLQALVLSPTRELASQIHQVMSALSDYLPIRCVACCGGKSNVKDMNRELSKGAHVVVGTPGRVLDLARQGSLRLDTVRLFVLDEADEMLNSGLRTQLEEIYRRLPSLSEFGTSTGRRAQVVIVSATLPPEHLELVQKFTRDPIRILVPRDELSLAVLKQFYIDVGSEEWKFETLCDLFASVCIPQTVVFVGTRRKVEWLSSQLRRDSFTVEAAHGELDQKLRETIMERFRSGSSRILVSSDMWARGIDVQNVGLVVNYDMPATPSDYLHRIGRSGRFGRRGLAVTFVAGEEDLKKLRTIARYYRASIEPAPSALDQMMLHLNPGAVSTVASAPTSSQLMKAIKKRRKKRKQKKHISLPH